MKTTLLIAASLVVATGCSFAKRSPEMYRDDTKAVLESKNNDIHACYDGVLKGTPGVGGKVTVKFDVVADGDEGAGKVANVTVDKANTTAPDAVADCVTKAIAGAGPLQPPDKYKGEGTFSYEFTAPPPPAAPAAPAAAPKS